MEQSDEPDPHFISLIATDIEIKSSGIKGDYQNCSSDWFRFKRSNENYWELIFCFTQRGKSEDLMEGSGKKTAWKTKRRVW